MFEWHTHLCEYYDVTPEEALKLGTRSNGRKPDLPGSETCVKVNDMTFEDIWESSERNTVAQIFKFYRDQGSWSTFRQCVRHADMENLHVSVFNFLLQNGHLKNNSHICEYGCGVAPFVTSFLKYFRTGEGAKIKFTLTDVDCDHFDFAKFRLNKIIGDLNLKDSYDLNFETIKPKILPCFDNTNIDVLFCFEVLEHVPSPVDVINNIKNNMPPGAIYIENFIKHELDDEEDGPDLLSARKERDKYYEIVNENFNLLHPTKEESDSNPNCTRVWQRNSM